MLLSEARASSLQALRNTFEAAFPDMSSKELFNLIRILHDYQTESEQKHTSVHMHNNVGFSVTDVKRLTSFYNFYKERGLYTAKQKLYIAALLQKHCGQLINHWIDKGVIIKRGRGDYEYVSKAEREAARQQAADAALAANSKVAAEEFKRQLELQNSPEYQAAQRVEKNHGQLDFLNEL